MTTITSLSQTQKTELRYKVLKYFEHGNFSTGMHDDPEFEGFSIEQVAQMRKALSDSSLIMIVNGKVTTGAAYELTEAGKILLNSYDF